jgi:hypothetical protein
VSIKVIGSPGLGPRIEVDPIYSKNGTALTTKVTSEQSFAQTKEPSQVSFESSFCLHQDIPDTWGTIQAAYSRLHRTKVLNISDMGKGGF